MKLLVTNTFQFRGVRREGVTLTVTEVMLRKEIELGKHPGNKKSWLSGLLEHCTPANDATAKFISEVSGEEVEGTTKDHDEEDYSEEIRELWAEFEEIGKGFDKRWKLETLQNRLIAAKKEIGERQEREKEAGSEEIGES